MTSDEAVDAAGETGDAAQETDASEDGGDS